MGILSEWSNYYVTLGYSSVVHIWKSDESLWNPIRTNVKSALFSHQKRETPIKKPFKPLLDSVNTATPYSVSRISSSATTTVPIAEKTKENIAGSSYMMDSLEKTNYMNSNISDTLATVLSTGNCF